MTIAAVPLYQAKAELFRVLAHPVRVRVLELLRAGPMPVRELLAAIGVEASSLSQHLGVLRRAGIVTAVREGSTVTYRLTGSGVEQLMHSAGQILTDMIAGRRELLADLMSADAQ